MGRKRVRDKHLPQRVYQRRGAFYFVDADNKWHPLGKDYGAMLSGLSRFAPQTLDSMDRVFDRYLLEVVPAKAEATQRENKRQLENLRRSFGATPPRSIKTSDVYAYVSARSKKAPTAALREKALLSHVFTMARNWGACDHNPCLKMALSHPKGPKRYITDAEYEAVYQMAPDYVQIAMDLALLTGLRQGDILALKTAADTPEGLLVHTGKTGKVLRFGWTPALRAVVDRARTRKVSSIYLLTNTRSRPVSKHGFRTVWKRLMARFVASGGQWYTFRDLRAKSASDSKTLAEASARLGHTSTAITANVYRRGPSDVDPLR